MTEAELDYVYDTYHPLRNLRGFTGTMVWDVTAPTWKPDEYYVNVPAEITCVSGPCIDLTGAIVYDSPTGRRIIYSRGPKVSELQISERIWMPNNQDSYRPIIDGYQYNIWGSTGTVFANTSITRLSDVPLPAGGALLLSGLFLLILRRRWGSQGPITHLS